MIVVEIGKISFKAWFIKPKKSGVEVKQLILKKSLDYAADSNWDFLDGLVKDLASALKAKNIKSKNIALTFDDEIVQKEFTHQRMSHENINKLAKIEAEIALRENVSDYIVVCRHDSDKANANNEQTSVLYALHTATIDKILDAFSKSKFKVIKIVPSSNAYANAIKRLVAVRKVKDMFPGGVFTSVDFSEEQTLVTIYKDYKVVFQRRQNSVFYDLVSLLCQVGGYDWNTASDMLYSKFDTDSFPQEFLLGASSLISTSVYDVLRTARIGALSDGEQQGAALISGELCSCPVFFERMIGNLNLDYVNINTIERQISPAIKVNDKAAKISDSLIAAGVGISSEWAVDMMDLVREKRKKVYANTTLNVTLAVAVLVAMCVMPAIYYFNQMTINQQEKMLEELSEARDLHDMSVALKNRVNKIGELETVLNGISSNSSGILGKVFDTYAGDAEITNLTYDGHTGDVTTQFNVNTVDGFVALKDEIYADSFYRLNLNMEFSRSVNQYNGTLRFTSTEVTPPTIGKEAEAE